MFRRYYRRAYVMLCVTHDESELCVGIRTNIPFLLQECKVSTLSDTIRPFLYINLGKAAELRDEGLMICA